MSLNRATLIGRLGQDPEIRTNGNGAKFATFTLATSETWKDKQTGEKKEQTDWHRIIVSSEGLTEICEKYLRKGTQILAEGRIRTRKYTGSLLELGALYNNATPQIRKAAALSALVDLEKLIEGE